jgi:hypothetical protein
MHGGAKGSGAPTGKCNGAWKHGGATREALMRVRELRAWLAIVKQSFDNVGGA